MKHYLLLPLALVPLALVAVPVHAERIEVVDDTGARVESYEIMWHTADHGYSHFAADEKTFLRGLPRDADVIDVVTRANGYATDVQRFSGDSLADLRAGKARVVLQQGVEVQLKLNVPEGMEVPEEFLPQLYFPEFAGRVRMMWQPANQRNDRVKPDFNLLNVSRIAERHYSFRLSMQATNFFVAFQHPGWLQFYELGPFSNQDIREQTLEIDVPRPATLRITLETGGVADDQLPFKDASVDIHWPNPEMDGSVYSTTWNERIQPGQTRQFSDLGPGQYSITIRTSAKEGVENLPGTEINPGRFFARREVDLDEGVDHTELFQWAPFDPTASRGDAHARLQLMMADGSPAAGVPLRVQWFDGHYGLIDVHNGLTPDNGVVQLDGISREIATESPYGPYTVELDGKTVGWFRLQANTDSQEFVFRMVPDVGDQSPDIEIYEIDTGQSKKLADYRGQVVLLEFWATWCGPCRPAMEKLNDLVAQQPKWKEQVVIIPLSVDQTPQLAADHVAQRGWTALRHCWSPRFDDGQSEAEHAFIVHGIPTAILLKPDGTIAWRGHPMAKYADGVDLGTRIEAVLTE